MATGFRGVQGKPLSLTARRKNGAGSRAHIGIRRRAFPSPNQNPVRADEPSHGVGVTWPFL